MLELAAFLRREILWRGIRDFHIIFANASCKRGIPAPDFVQCNAPEEQTACRGVSFYQPSTGHNV
jgi:hypothetical protein